MRRISLGPALAVAVLLGLFAADQGGGTRAQDSTPMPGPHPVVGSWWVNLAVTGAMDQEAALDTFAADGTLLASVKSVSLAPPDAPFGQIFTSLMHGSWTATGPDQVALTLVRLQTDEGGNYLGTVTVRAVLDVSSDGQRLSGPFTYDVADPAGNVVASGTGTAEGTRITVEPMGTPAVGTPSA